MTRGAMPRVPTMLALFRETAAEIVVAVDDRAGADAVDALARDADVLIREVLYVPGIERLLARVPNAATLREHLIASHTPTYDVGRVAKEARVKKLVLTHLVPWNDSNRSLAEAKSSGFGGDIELARQGATYDLRG